MIAMNGGGHGHPGQATADELQHGHLGRGVLHGHAVRVQAKVRSATVDVLSVGLSQVTVHDLLRQGERPIESTGKVYLGF